MKRISDLNQPDLAPLGVREVAGATVLPWRAGEARGTLEMGVLDARGHVLHDTLIRRSYANGREGQVGYPGQLTPASGEVRPGTAIYAGPWLEHFGHFLLEGLARTWAVRRHPELPVVWSAAAEKEDDTALAPGEAPGLNGWRAALLELLGIRNEMIFATRPLGFERLLVPEAGYRIQHFCHPEQAAALGVVEHRPEPGRRLWLTRSRLRQLQNLSMPAVEARLEELGWTVIAPETLTIPEQMDHLARAERVAGEMGSQLHPLLFLKEARGLRVDVLLRDPSRPPEIYNRNYDTIAAARGLDQRLHRMTSEIVLRKRGVQVEKLSTNLGEYFRALDIPEGPGTPATTNTKRRHGAAATNTERRHAAAGARPGAGRRPGMKADMSAHTGATTDSTEEGHRMPNDPVTPDPATTGAGPAANSGADSGTDSGAGLATNISASTGPDTGQDTGADSGADSGADISTDTDTTASVPLASGLDGRPTLDALAEHFNTDKATRYRTREGKEIDGHAYADFYDRFFRDFRDEPITVLELGCGQVWNIGASLRMLKAYFPQAEIIGVDNKPAARQLASDGFRIEVGDLGKIEFLRQLRRFRPTILIDDASHLWSHQILAMAELYDTLPSGGIYVMEDINTSFGHMRETYSAGATFSGHDFVNAVSTALHTFDDDHLKAVPYPEYVAYVARQTAFVAQFRHTALFVRR